MTDQSRVYGSSTSPSVSQFDFDGARNAGYSDAEIVNHLATSGLTKFDVNGALKAGYSPSEVIKYLGGTSAPSGVADSFREGLAEVPSGIASTLKNYTGPSPVSSALSEGAKAIAPSDYTPAPLVDAHGIHPGNIPQWIAAHAPSMATAIAAARVTPGPWWAKLLSGAAAGTLMGAGNEAQTAATNRTGKPDAVPNSADLTRGALTSAAENAVGTVGLSRFVPGAGPIANTGIKGLARAATTLTKTIATQGLSGAGQSVVGQVGQSVGTPGGVSVDPTQVADAAAGNAIVGGGFGALQAAHASANALKYRGITPDLMPAATQFANRLNQSADGGNLNAGIIGGGKAQRLGAEVFTKAQDAVHNELTDAVHDVRGRMTLPTDADNIVSSALKGQHPNERDYATVKTALGSDPQADNIMNLLRQAHVANIVENSGRLTGDKFVGGLSAIPTALSTHSVGKTALAALGGAALEGGAGHVIAYSPEALMTVAGLAAAARLADRLTGARSPAGRFVSNFADDSSPVRLRVPQAPAPTPTGPTVGPTGPSIPPRPTPWGPEPMAPPEAFLSAQDKAQMKMAAMPLLRKLAQTTKPLTLPAAFASTLSNPDAAKGMSAVRGASVLAKLRSDPEAQAGEVAATHEQAKANAAALKAAKVSSTARQATPAPNVTGDTPLPVAPGMAAYRLPLAPYWDLSAPEAAKRIMRDRLAANVPIKDAGAFLAKTIGVLNTLRDRMQAVTQAAPTIPAVEVARFEGIKTQKDAAAYRDYLKGEHPQAADVLDRVFSNEAIASQWAQKH